MKFISTFPIISQVILYGLLSFMALFAVLIFVWQVLVLAGRSMQNSDGSTDDWREQKLFYGIALADILVACPVTIAGVVMILAGIPSGYFVTSLSAFWFLWANIMTTATSLRFENPKITFGWIITFPTEIVVGGGYLLWVFFHYGQVIG